MESHGVVRGGDQVEEWDIPLAARTALIRDGVPAAVGFTMRAAMQSGVDPELESDAGSLYEIARAALPPEPALVLASFGVEPGSGHVLKVAFGETSAVNSSVPAFLSFLAVEAEVFTHLYGAPAQDPMEAVSPPPEVLWSVWMPALRRLLEIDRLGFTDDSHWYAEYFDLWEACGFPAIDGESPFRD